MAQSHQTDSRGGPPAWQENVTAGSCPTPQYTFSDGTNRIQTYSYHAAGNLLNDAFHNYTYDAEGRLLTVDSTAVSYVYDAFGQRVRSTVSSTAYDYIFNGGKAVDQLAGGAWVWGHAGGAQGITYNNSSTYFDHADWVGTVRARSNVSGARIETCTSLPFGESQSCAGTDESPEHFAGLQWDSESNLQHAWFRQLSTTEGRWTVPDPSGLAAVTATNPQTWNRYSDVVNNPLSNVDPFGLLICSPDNGIWTCKVDVWAPLPPWIYDAGTVLVDYCDYHACQNPIDQPTDPNCHYMLLNPCGKPANNGPPPLLRTPAQVQQCWTNPTRVQPEKLWRPSARFRWFPALGKTRSLALVKPL